MRPVRGILGISALLSLAGVITLFLYLPADYSQAAQGQLAVVSVVFVLATAFFVPHQSPWSIAGAFLKLFCLYFTVKAAGTQAAALALLLLSFHFEVFLALHPLQAGFLDLLLFRIITTAAGPHTAWNLKVDGPGIAALSILTAVSAAGALTGSMLRRTGMKEERLESQLSRLEQAVSNLTETNEAYQTYATYIEENSKEDERNRITREIHDIVGYSMTNLLMIVRAALYSENQDQVTELLQKAETHINDSMQEIRVSLRKLRSVRKKALHGLELMGYLTGNFSRVTGIEVVLEVIAFPREIPEGIEEILYRMLQECMTNSFRHGRAKKIEVTFQVHGSILFVKIRDDGAAQGPLNAEAPEGIGLAGMRERIEALDGTLTTVASVDGFTVFARIPYHGKER